MPCTYRIVAIGCQSSPAQAPEPQPAPRSEQLPERDKLAKQVDNLRQAGKFDEAVPIAERVLELERKSGDANPARVADALSRLAELHELRGDWSGALARRKEALTVRKSTDGEDHWRTVNARLALAFEEKTAGLAALDQAKLGSALRKQEDATRLAAQGKYEQAERVMREVLATYQSLVGPETAEVARAWHVIGRTYLKRGDPRGAKEPNAQALKIRRKLLPGAHPEIALSLNNLGVEQALLGDFAAARKTHEEALAIRRRTLRPDDPDIAQSLINVGIAQQNLRDYSAAKTSYQEALAVLRRALPKGHPDIAQSLLNLGVVQQGLRDYAAARKSHQEALAIRRMPCPRTTPISPTALTT